MLVRETAADIDQADFLVSEKYDGVRAVRDGCGLRFRSGLPVAVAAWFTRRVRPPARDGELWLAGGRTDVSRRCRACCARPHRWKSTGARRATSCSTSPASAHASPSARSASMRRPVRWRGRGWRPWRSARSPAAPSCSAGLTRPSSSAISPAKVGKPAGSPRRACAWPEKWRRDPGRLQLHQRRTRGVAADRHDRDLPLPGSDDDRRASPRELLAPRRAAAGVQSTSLAKSARRERSPRASITWPPCGQPLKRSTA
jgi:hypothetical protein